MNLSSCVDIIYPAYNDIGLNEPHLQLQTFYGTSYFLTANHYLTLLGYNSPHL
jgi:hypothetical protein